MRNALANPGRPHRANLVRFVIGLVFYSKRRRRRRKG
jgi:hypothetical protein